MGTSEKVPLFKKNSPLEGDILLLSFLKTNDISISFFNVIIKQIKLVMDILEHK